MTSTTASYLGPKDACAAHACQASQILLYDSWLRPSTKVTQSLMASDDHLRDVRNLINRIVLICLLVLRVDELRVGSGVTKAQRGAVASFWERAFCATMDVACTHHSQKRYTECSISRKL